jgi:GPH family glycoside/pentoside/hexuronide:cation symporter
MSQKIAWAIGAFFTGALLSSYGFIADKAQSIEVNGLLVMLMSIIPSAFGLISIILILFYKLDEQTMKTIQVDLEQRRIASGDKIVTN